ncbi:DNA adenine methylase [Mesomycoplasma lagogenitalium]|uniref:site-specific DNA-methyltransferase (adenine-specific) n=1 Tax=Mesomycoplasma lagogenitalium TaxID=171286 RepID=A0ABY8LU66_9BACT|nr:DNA adenine methylase [Mesomycoplasma lagogenitalium]WGI36785.1 DNA adenine methylase [Mesomycoplasma lagogenitalium]
MSKKISPFVKWVGGKTQILNEIKKRMPKKFNKYYEPFVGGGALLFEIMPEVAIINDINSHLINAYKKIKTDHKKLLMLLKKWDNEVCDKNLYFQRRKEFNLKIINNTNDVEAAALFIYLNKRCFNGIYRVNSKGLFNVPFNNKAKVNSFSEDNIKNIGYFLKKVKILNLDFEKALVDATKDDFIFFDSPYAPLTKTSFNSYTENGFGVDDHIRLFNLFKQLDEKGCYVMLTNHNTPFINELYKDYKIEIINVKRMVNSDANNRYGQEVIITNYLK